MSPLAFHVLGDSADTQAALLYQASTAARRRILFVLAHGAGAGHAHPWMVKYARAIAGRGVDVVTFNFPYKEAGRSAPDRAPVLEDAFRRVVVSAVAHRHVDAARLFIGGKSMGGRIATHLASTPDVWPAEAPSLSGVVVFGYPLNPPGGSKRSADRVSHLARIAAPTLVVQGTRDTFGGPDSIRDAVKAYARRAPIEVQGIDGGDHSLAVRKSTQEPIDNAIWDDVVKWMERVTSDKVHVQS
jgi:predicted alpha/beta-hydrolase family hydrolase